MTGSLAIILCMAFANAEIYELVVLEAGTLVEQTVIVDDDNQAVIITMPSHNNLVAVDSIIDYQREVVVDRFPATNQCTIKSLSIADHPSFADFTQGMPKFSNKLWENIRNTTHEYDVASHVTDLSVYGDRIATFCQGRTVLSLTPAANLQLERKDGDVHIFNSVSAKLNIGGSTMSDCPPHLQRSACVYYNKHCKYVTTCDSGNECTTGHFWGEVRCCIPCCDWAPGTGPGMPYCQDVKAEDIPC